MILFILSNNVAPDQKIFFWIPAHTVDAASVNASGMSIFSANGKPILNNVPASLTRNSLDWMFLNTVFTGISVHRCVCLHFESVLTYKFL